MYNIIIYCGIFSVIKLRRMYISYISKHFIQKNINFYTTIIKKTSEQILIILFSFHCNYELVGQKLNFTYVM